MCAFVQDCEWRVGITSVAVRFGSVQSVDESLHCRIRWCLYSAGVSECGCVWSFLILNSHCVYICGYVYTCRYQDRSLTKKYLRTVEREMHFLFLPMGRGIFYTFCGTLLIVKGGVFSSLSGICILLIGCLLFYSNRQAVASLSEIQAGQFDDQKIQQLFNTYDKSGDGALAPAEWVCHVVYYTTVF